MAITHIDQHTGNVVDVDIKDVVHSINGRGYGYFETKEKKQAWPNWPIGESPLLASTISIAQLIDEVNISFKSVLSKNVLNRLNGTTDTKGVYTGKTLFSLKDVDAQSEKYTIPGYMYPARLNNALTRNEFRLLRENLVNKLQTEYTDSEHQTRNLIVPITYHGDDTKIVILDADSYAISDIYRVATWAYDGRIADLINRFERVIIKNGRHDFDKWMESFSGIRGTRICWKYVGHRFGNFDADLRAEASRRGVEPSQLLEGWSERGRLSENGGGIPGGSFSDRNLTGILTDRSMLYGVEDSFKAGWTIFARRKPNFASYRTHLGNAVKAEQADLHPDINVKVEDFPNLCGKRPASLMDWV